MVDVRPQGSGDDALIGQLIVELKDAIKALRAENAELRAGNAELRTENAELRRRLEQNSTNSHKPPSSDAPGKKPVPANAAARKKRGKGRKGHKGHHRSLLPTEQCDEVRHYAPLACSRCGPAGGFRLDAHGVAIEVKPPTRHQVVDVLPRVLVEHQCHAHQCTACGKVTRAALPDEVPRSAFGERLHAMVPTLTGRYQMSKRDVVEFLGDVMKVLISLGSVSQIEARMTRTLGPPVSQAHEVAKQQPLVNADETSWLERHCRSWLWVLVSGVTTVFMLDAHRDKAAAKRLLGEDFSAVVGTDRWGSYEWVGGGHQQYCWAHLERDFVAISQVSDRPRTAALGLALVVMTEQMFEAYNDLVRDGPTSELATFHQRVKDTFRPAFEALLQGIVLANEHDKSVGTARSLLQSHAQTAMWRFAEVSGLQPTNNAAERALRRAVLWRKRSLGTQSWRGARFVERILTVVETLRGQGRSVFEYLTQVSRACLQNREAPSLILAAA